MAFSKLALLQTSRRFLHLGFQQMRNGEVSKSSGSCTLISPHTKIEDRTQDAYQKSVTHLFESLSRVEKLLENSAGPYIQGDRLTEVDIRLYPTIVRFDVVYVSVCCLFSKVGMNFLNKT